MDIGQGCTTRTRALGLDRATTGESGHVSRTCVYPALKQSPDNKGNYLRNWDHFNLDHVLSYQNFPFHPTSAKVIADASCDLLQQEMILAIFDNFQGKKSR